MNQLHLVLENLGALKACGVIVDVRFQYHPKPAQMILRPNSVLLTNNVAGDLSYLDKWDLAAREFGFQRWPIQNSTKNWFVSLRGEWPAVAKQLLRIFELVFEASEEDEVLISVFV